MTRKEFISLVVMGIFLILETVSPSTAVTPIWSYEIESMADFAMSENGEYLIVVCEKGPSYEEKPCEKGQFYVFDRYGTIVDDGCIESEITTVDYTSTVVDIANNGAFFVRTRNGYYFFSGSGKIIKKTDMEHEFKSVSMSENGEVVIAGTTKEIFIFNGYGVKDKKGIDEKNKEEEKKSLYTAISASGNIAVAWTNDTLFLYENTTDTWMEKSIEILTEKAADKLVDTPTISSLVGVAVSDDGSTVVCGMAAGTILVLDSMLEIQEAFSLMPEKLKSIVLAADGNYLVCGTRGEKVSCLDLSGNLIWKYPKENSEKKVIKDIAISSDGNLVAVLSENIILLDSSGEKLQELRPSESIQRMQLSKSGEILSYSLHEKLIFLELYQRGYALNHEYMLPSKSRTTAPDELVKKWSYNGTSPQSVIAADINGDGQNEIICSFPKNLVVLNSKGKLLWEKPFTFELEIAAMDLTFDFVPEVIVISKDNYMRVQAFDGTGRSLASHSFYTRWYPELPPEEQPIRIHALWSDDIDNDSIMEVVCKVSDDYLFEARGIYVFEYPSFEKEWYYPSAPNVATVNIADLDNDGNLEIVCGSIASCRGQEVKGTDDCHAYVFAINLHGEKLWVKEIGSGYKGVCVTVADLDGDGTNEVVGGGWSVENDWGELFTLNAQEMYIKEVTLDHSILLKGASDLDFDGDMEVLVSDEEGALAVYDHNLQLLRKSNIGILPESALTVNDLDGDGKKEIIAISKDESIVILDSQLENEVILHFSDLHSALVVNLSRCKNDLLILADKLYLYLYESQSEQPCKLPIKTIKEKIERHINDGEKYFEDGDYERALEEYNRAIEMLDQVGDTENLQDIKEKAKEKKNEAYNYNIKFLEAEQLLQKSRDFLKGKGSLEQEDFQEVRKWVLKAWEIYQDIDRNDKMQEANGILLETVLLHYNADLLRLAPEYNARGDEKESQEDYEGAIWCYKIALYVYERFGMTEEEEKVQEQIEQTEEKLREQARDDAITRINISIIQIAFVISLVVVTVLYIHRKEYKGKNWRKNAVSYGFTLIALVAILGISYIAVSLPLGDIEYFVTILMCLLFFMILSTYWRES